MICGVVVRCLLSVLPETSVTEYSGHMGDTFALFERRGHALEGVSRHGRAAPVCGPPARGREDGAPLRRIWDLAQDRLQDLRSLQGRRRRGVHGSKPAALPPGESTAAAA